MSERTAEKGPAALSPSDAGNRCDVTPSRFKRLDRDEYFTIDAGWIIPALCCAVQVEGPILEPCAGRGHMVRTKRPEWVRPAIASPRSLVQLVRLVVGAARACPRSLSALRWPCGSLTYAAGGHI